MQVISHIQAFRDQIHVWRMAGESIAFVPTMGNLHAGHLALVKEAGKSARRVVVSIFVNPLQFGPNEDFAAYPRTLDQDLQQLQNEAVDLVFTPTEPELYPQGKQEQTKVLLPESLTNILCGATRPGHFTGVATVVLKLFQIVQPDIAIFGKKDFQQVAVVRKMVFDLNLPVQIQSIETLREANGLAMSSRNQYLTEEERLRASAIYQTMQSMRDALCRGVVIEVVQQQGKEALVAQGFAVDYVVVRRAADLQVAEPRVSQTGLSRQPEQALVILVAAKLGKARLIDNLEVLDDGLLV